MSRPNVRPQQEGRRVSNGKPAAFWLATIDRRLGRLGRPAIVALAFVGVGLVGAVDYLAGYEVAISLFYLGPVAVAAWYAGRRAGVAVAVASCISWYVADVAAGHPYSHPVIPAWNALVRLGFFLVTGLLLAALRESLNRQRDLARTDSLTGLLGRRALEERLQHDLALAQRRGSALTLAYVDVDDFKAVNDSRGHAEGDRVLRAIGQALGRSVRQTDTAARLGGDEFALVLPDTDGVGARQAIETLGAELRRALAAGAAGISCSIGVVTFLRPALSPESVLAAADELMYEVKRNGKGAVAFSVIGSADAPRQAGEPGLAALDAAARSRDAG